MLGRWGPNLVASLLCRLSRNTQRKGMEMEWEARSRKNYWDGHMVEDRLPGRGI